MVGLTTYHAKLNLAGPPTLTPTLIPTLTPTLTLILNPNPIPIPNLAGAALSLPEDRAGK